MPLAPLKANLLSKRQKGVLGNYFLLGINGSDLGACVKLFF